ncbi:thioesterase (plasmid) [Mycetohabitans rhizoxinica]|uniref:thioesterase II family protein n=1 Tax=Mycetohabitans rhizoxinica TaxID=412963 RepID=UPI0030D04830
MRKLFCFPFAGAGASVFRPWIEPLSDSIEVVSVQLPGREQLLAAPPFTNVHQAISKISTHLAPAVAEAHEIVIFGHSLGAVLAYEFAKTIHADKSCLLMVSGSPAPSRMREQRATGLDDEQFVERVRELAGYSHPALEDPDMRELLLPTLRADVEMHEGYKPISTTALKMPIVGVRGDRDELVSREDVVAWSDATQSVFEYVEVEGGHMYLTETPERLFDLFRQAGNRMLSGKRYAA